MNQAGSNPTAREEVYKKILSERTPEEIEKMLQVLRHELSKNPDDAKLKFIGQELNKLKGRAQSGE